MARGCGKNHAFGRSGLMANDQIVAAEIEALQSHGHEREQRAMPPPPGVEEGGDDAVAADLFAEYSRIAKQREYVGLRKQAAESIQNFFAAAAIQKPVMHDGDAHVAYQLTAGAATEDADCPGTRLFTAVTEDNVISNICESTARRRNPCYRPSAKRREP